MKNASREHRDAKRAAPAPRRRRVPRTAGTQRSAYDRVTDFAAWAQRASERGDRELAVRHLRRALALAPEQAWLWCNLACELHPVAPAASDAAYAQAWRLLVGRGLDLSTEWGDEAGLACAIGNWLRNKGDMEQARVLLSRAVMLCPNEPTFSYNWAMWLEDQGLWDDALPIWLRLVVEQPDELALIDGIVACHYSMGRFEEAEPYLRQLMALDPLCPLHRLHLAVVTMNLGRPDEGLLLFADLLRARPDDPVLHAQCGIAHALAGRDDEARREQAEALRLGAGLPEVDEYVAEIDEILADDGDGDGDGTDQEAARQAAALLLLALLGLRRAGRR